MMNLPPKARCFNEIVYEDFFHETVQMDSGPRKYLLISMRDEWNGYAQVAVLEQAATLAARKTMSALWLSPYGAPRHLFCDSEEMRHMAQRYCTSLRTTAAESPWQHSRIQRWHQPKRRMVLETYRGLTEPGKFDIYDIVEQCVMTRNENVRVRGVSPYVLVFGTHPRREVAAGEGGHDYNADSIVSSLLTADPGYEAAVIMREAAGKA